MEKTTFGKLLGGRKTPKKIQLDEGILQRAKISILTLDERWNRLFQSIEKPAIAIKYEEALMLCVKEQARLTAESKENQAQKRASLKRIVALTADAFGQDGEAALAEIGVCEAKVRAINARAIEIRNRLDALTQEIRTSNIALLENVIPFLYADMKNAQSRVAMLDAQISEMRNQLREHISERETLDASYNETYHFLHGLLGAEQIEALDRHYLLE